MWQQIEAFLSKREWMFGIINRELKLHELTRTMTSPLCVLPSEWNLFYLYR